MAALSERQMSDLASMVSSLLTRAQGPAATTPRDFPRTAAPTPTPVPYFPQTAAPTPAPYFPQTAAPTPAPYFPQTAAPTPTPTPAPTRKPRKPKTQRPSTSPPDASSGGGSGAWQTATATWYTSYPECCHDKKADQSECEDYSGCKWEGQFAAFDGKQPKAWVESNNLVAFYTSPNSKNRKEWEKKWKNKKLRIRNPRTGKEMDVTVVDTCDNDDCNGCCSKNANINGGFLVDLEKNTAKRFYDGKVEDLTAIQWRVI